jgi:hypothetical protein
MTTPLERVRMAWATGDRMELHREVERLAADGHSRPELEAALESLLREVRSGGASDEEEEGINGVWDRVTGWCDPATHIHPRAATLPASATPPMPTTVQTTPTN